MNHHLRVARPVADPTHSARMYYAALSLELLSSFYDHEGFDGTIVGKPGASYHFEFTRSRNHSLEATPTAEDLIVLYIASKPEWESVCSSMLSAGFTEVQSFNPYWDVNGKTFEDDDGYRVVLENASWA